MYKQLDEEFFDKKNDNKYIRLVRPKKHEREAYTRYRVFANGIIETDLFVMPEFNKYNYFLAFIDIRTRQMFVLPLKVKDKKTIRGAFEKALIYYKKIRFIYCDPGAEFNNDEIKAFCKENDIFLRISRVNRNANSVVEAYGGIVKKYLLEILSVKSLQDKRYILNWVEPLDDVVRAINKYNKTQFPKEYYETEWIVQNDKKGDYKVGQLVHPIIDAPKGLLNDKRLHGSLRYGDLHFEKEPRKIEQVLPSNKGTPVRYLIEGINNASYMKKELLPSN